MFLLFILLRPSFDIIGNIGISYGFSALNFASIITLLFIIASFFFIIRKKKYIYIPKEVKFYSIFLIFAAIGTIYNFNIVKLNGLFALSRLVAVLFIMLIILQEYTNIRRLEKLFRMLMYSMVVPVLYAIVQMFTKINTSYGEGFIRVNGGFAHSNVFATYLSIFIIILYALLMLKKEINFKNKIKLWGIETILLICLLFTYGRGTWISLCVSILIISICYIQKKSFWPIFMIIPVFLTILFFVGKLSFLGDISARFEDVNVFETTSVLSEEGNSLGWRIQYWKELLTKALKSPIYGYGLGSVEILGSYHLEAHNNYVHIFFETGIGVFFYFVILIIYLKKALGHVKSKNTSQKYFFVGVIGIILFYLTLSISGHLIRNTVFQTYFFSFLTLGSCFDKVIFNNSPRKINRYS
jgi:O-antigen ligase